MSEQNANTGLGNSRGAGATPCPDGTIIDRLYLHARTSPDRLAYKFLHDSREADELTYGELARRVRSIASRLAVEAAFGDRALLVYPPGLEFIEAFLGCLAAGIIAVPAYPPRRNRKAERFNAIIDDARPHLFLTTRQTLPVIEADETGAIKGLVRLTTETVETQSASKKAPVVITGDTVAFLQYTSGSTGNPRGVVITHKNIVRNEAVIKESFRHTRESVMVSWLPVFHDMGLIGGVLQPLYVGFPSILLSPVTFLQEPIKWLRAIMDHRATTTGGPNFAWDHCAGAVTEEQKEGLDLSSLQISYNGAEPVRAETLERFTAAFSRCKFRPQSFFPCYGLAESTLFVSGGPPQQIPFRVRVCSTLLEAHAWMLVGDNYPDDSRWLVSSGEVARGTRVEIVNPDTCRRSGPKEVGEIWLASDSIAQGYWNRPEETRQVLQATLAETGEGPFLRTGDLGYLDNGELFITGRLKDLIIIRGRNLYPQDIEAAVERALTFVKPNSCAAFALEENGRERLGVVIEADRALVRIARTASEGNGKGEAAVAELARTVGKVRQVIGEEFEVPVHAVAFVRPGSFPRTSSGKVQRRPCRDGLRNGTLDVVHAWPQSIDLREAIHAAVVRRLRAEVDPGIVHIDYNAPLTAQGLDSISAAAIAIEVGKVTGVRLSPGLVYEYGTINRLATYVAACLPAFREQAAQAPRAERPVQDSDDLSGTMAELANPFLQNLLECIAAPETLASLTEPNPVTIRSVVTTEEREMVWRFRYTVFVEEKCRNIANADRERRRITDPLDATGRIIAAFDPTGKVVGSLRVNLLRESDISSFRQRYRLGQISSAEATSVSISTRYAIAREHRGGALAVRLLRHACQDLIAEGITRDYAACRSDGLPFFASLGYKVRYQWTDPDGVDLVAIYFDFTDLEHLRAINSPLLPVIERHVGSRQRCELREKPFHSLRSAKCLRPSSPRRRGDTRGPTVPSFRPWSAT
jgi:acyl-CoA synthetase (AMP-forming)/AMP-acid ligase II